MYKCIAVYVCMYVRGMQCNTACMFVCMSLCVYACENRHAQGEVIDTAARLGRSVGAFERLLASVSSRRHKATSEVCQTRRAEFGASV